MRRNWAVSSRLLLIVVPDLEQQSRYRALQPPTLMLVRASRSLEPAIEVAAPLLLLVTSWRRRGTRVETRIATRAGVSSVADGDWLGVDAVANASDRVDEFGFAEFGSETVSTEIGGPIARPV